MTRETFLDELKRIGLTPQHHDVDALHAAFLRLSQLMPHLDTEDSPEDARSLARFDPRDPL